MRRRKVRDGVVAKVSAAMRTTEAMVDAPGAARKAEQHAERHQRQRREGAQQPGAAPEQQILRQPDDRRREERPEHVGILERPGSAGARVEREVLAEPGDVEIAEHAQRRREYAGRDVAGADRAHALERRLGDQRGEEDRGQSHIDRDGDEGDAFALGDEGRQRQQASGVERGEADDQRDHRPVERQIGRTQRQRRDDEHEFVRRRLDGRHGAAEHERPQDGALEGRRARQRPRAQRRFAAEGRGERAHRFRTRSGS